ncbi:MAG: hypothetical protein JF607_01160 [Burkholderiales bacterium]|jgi:hypothetical protein|nr:hypothetical protein [Burkholderiales bacterium]MBW8894100.1 hypothetical protein [Burkholderiales bacterium]
MNRLLRALPFVALLLSLSACGGGGNESGQPDQLYLSTTDVTVGTPDRCYEGLGPEVHIYGGTPPYRLANSVPQGMVLNKAVVQNSGESFSITFVNGVCMKTMPITVEDQQGLLTHLSVTNGG